MAVGADRGSVAPVARQRSVAAGRGGGAQAQATQIWQPQRPPAQWPIGLTAGTRLGDMAQGVGAGIAKNSSVGTGADAQRVQHQYDGFAHRMSWIKSRAARLEPPDR